jgi:hypothetical protein
MDACAGGQSIEIWLGCALQSSSRDQQAQTGSGRQLNQSIHVKEYSTPSWHERTMRAHDRGAAAAAARCELAACELTYDMTTTAFLVSGSVMATGRAHT